MNNPLVILVNPDDEAIAVIDKLSAHKYAMLHRAFSVFIYRIHQGKIEMLLQQRQLNKYHCGGLWSNACCSHPLPTETVEQAGARRLKEELGIQSTLQNVGRFHYVAVLDDGFFENEIDYVLVGTTDNTDIPFNRDEVNDVKWVTADEARAWLKQKPEEFTPWFGRAMDLCLEYLNRKA